MTAEYTLFTRAYGTFFRMNNRLHTHKINLDKFKRTHRMQSMFSNHNEIKFDIIIRNKSFKFHKYLEIKQCPSK